MRVYVCDHELNVNECVKRKVSIDYVNCKRLFQEKKTVRVVVSKGELVYCNVYDHHPSLPCVGVSDIVLGVGEGI